MSPSRILTANEVRQQFIDFFVERAGHTFVPSSPVVPHDDPTLLFTNAGMNQFKPIFLGQVDPTSPLAKLKRAVNSQKCIRAGGKHNDLDDVGRDTYHHTFFEMLGNWSFGDYFKAEAIQWAWELLTGIWGLDPNRLYASYFEGNPSLGLEPDRESFDLWRKYLPANRIIPGNMKDNFWEMGDTGPCGPCSEIHYDGRSDADRKKVDGATLVNRDNPEVIEIWNLVFIQFNRTGPTSLDLLPAKHVDTGMGLERITRVLQGKNSNYDTDAFTPLFRKIQDVTKANPYDGGPGSLTNPIDVAYRVIADHVRTLTISITDGAEPSNEGRGYVLRRILRRAVRFGRQVLGYEKPFMGAIVPTVVESLGGAFPELKKDPARVITILTDEEEAFGRTLRAGLALFDKAAANDSGYTGITADDAFKLHDTYGFPIDLTQLMAAERGLTVDVEGFHRLMEEARERSRGGGGATGETALTLPTNAVASLQKLSVKPTDDAMKYTADRPVRARVEAIWNGTDFDENLHASHTRPTDRFAVILDKTSFYAESGGQVGDVGRLVVAGGAGESRAGGSSGGGEFIVEDARVTAGFVVHVGRIRSGEIRVGDYVECRIDQKRRKAIAANHTSTHLLNRALRDVLGAHVDQRGSLVAPDRLRFDFAHHGPMTDQEAHRITEIVRADIAANLEVFAKVSPLAPARKINTLRAVFGETYPDPVRVVSIGVPVDLLVGAPTDPKWMERSVEFCGGTHLARTGDAGAFAIVSEEGVAKGVRRAVALTGEPASAAIDHGSKLRSRAQGAATLPEVHLKAEIAAIQHDLDTAEIPVEDRLAIRALLEKMQVRLKDSAKESAKAGKEGAVDAARALASSAHGPIVIGEIPAGSDRGALLAAMDVVRGAHQESAVMLLSADAEAGKVTIVAQVPKAMMDRGLKAGDWVRVASEACGGKGGGRPDSAQGGGTDPTKVRAAIDAAKAHASSAAGAAV